MNRHRNSSLMKTVNNNYTGAIQQNGRHIYTQCRAKEVIESLDVISREMSPCNVHVLG